VTIQLAKKMKKSDAKKNAVRVMAIVLAALFVITGLAVAFPIFM